MKTRDQIAAKDKWAVDKMYPSYDKWAKDCEVLEGDIKAISRYAGLLSKGSSVLKETLDLSTRLDLKLENIFVYAHLKHDEDVSAPLWKEAYEKSVMLQEKFAQLSSFILPEIKKLDESKLFEYINSSDLKEYKVYLENVSRLKPYILSDKEERLMSIFLEVTGVSGNVFRAFTDGDMKFPDISLKNGSKKELTHGKYHGFITSDDREERFKAFHAYHGEYLKSSLTFASLLQGCVKAHYSAAKARGFNSCLEASLYTDNIPCAVYENLIETVSKRLDVNHKYFEIKKQYLGLDELHLYDVYAPMEDQFKKQFDFAGAVNCFIDSISPLGDEYVSIVKGGIKDGWIDKYENQNKRSGAYSSGSYESYPYILLNFDSSINSVFTLAHEMGHSMHSWYSNKTQSPVYAAYSIFIAEIASTVNEQILGHRFLEKYDSDSEKIYILCHLIEGLRATLVRQTMFAEFELFIHRSVENSQPLTDKGLKDKYMVLNRKYFGPEVVVDQPIEIEWARIPHFYYNFYVYQYATGVSAALDITSRIISGDESYKNDYISFLSAGASDYPLEVIKKAGVDLTSPDPINRAMDYYDQLLDKLSALIIKKQKQAS